MTPPLHVTKEVCGLATKVRPGDNYGLSTRHVMTKREPQKRKYVITAEEARKLGYKV